MALFRHWHSSVHTAFILTFTTESASTPRAASLAARSCGLSGSRNTAGGPEARARTRIHSASGCAAGSLGTAARTRRPRASKPSRWPPGLFGHHNHHNGVADETERDWLVVRPRRLHPRAFGHGWHCCPGHLHRWPLCPSRSAVANASQHSGRQPAQAGPNRGQLALRCPDEVACADRSLAREPGSQHVRRKADRWQATEHIGNKAHQRRWRIAPRHDGGLE
jgi:hypothetical protein